MKKAINNLRENLRGRIEEALRKACGRITPSKRMMVIVVASVLFAVGCIWMTTSAIYNMGKQRELRQFEEMQHIKSLLLPPSAPGSVAPDSTTLDPSAPQPGDDEDRALSKAISDLKKTLGHE